MTTVRRRLIRIFVPAMLIIAWLVAASVGGPYFGKIEEVSSNDQTAYLPANADATVVQQRLGEFLGEDSLPAVIVVSSSEPLSAETMSLVGERLASLAGSHGIEAASPVIPSEDGLAAQVFVPISAEADLAEAVEAINETLGADLPAGVQVHVTGPAGFAHDLVGAFAGIDGILLLVALAAVLVILVIVYRSVLLPFVVLLTSLFALCVALLTVWWLAKAGVFLLSGQTQGILFILVIGAATDYSLLMVARYADELKHQQDKGIAIVRAWRGSLEAILASGGTVIAGLLCLMLSDLRSNSNLGPVAAVGIAFAMLAALTLLPAALFVGGRVLFWPRMPKASVEAAGAAGPAGTEGAAGAEGAADPVADASGLWKRVAGLVRRRPRVIWIVTALLLAAGCLGVGQLRATGVPQSSLLLTTSAARDGQEILAAHFPGGSGSPAQILVPEEKVVAAAEVILANPGVASLAVVADTPSGTAPVTTAGIQPFAPGAPTPVAKVAEGDVLLQATLRDAADSAAAESTIRTLRTALAEQVSEAKVGGVTATDIDTNDASIHDRNLIIPVILAVIVVILMLLLRSIVAPLVLIATTVLSFGAAMGVSALVFNHVLGFPGADPAVPLFGFVFLVALGIDYNIFLMTRVREESLHHGTVEGVSRGLQVTGGVITSAGVVLAATFTALAVIPVLFLAQLAFIVAFGVLLDTIVVRSLLVPAIATDMGRAIWWPSRLGRHDR